MEVYSDFRFNEKARARTLSARAAFYLKSEYEISRFKTGKVKSSINHYQLPITDDPLTVRGESFSTCRIMVNG